MNNEENSSSSSSRENSPIPPLQTPPPTFSHYNPPPSIVPLVVAPIAAAPTYASSTYFVQRQRIASATTTAAPAPYSEQMKLTSVAGPGSQYVKLNVGGSLHYTTIATLTKHDSMLRAMFSGRLEVLTDGEGWVLIDRCGKHFPIILNFLRDGTVALPESRREVMEILAEAKYFCLQVLTTKHC